MTPGVYSTSRPFFHGKKTKTFNVYLCHLPLVLLDANTSATQQTFPATNTNAASQTLLHVPCTSTNIINCIRCLKVWVLTVDKDDKRYKSYVNLHLHELDIFKMKMNLKAFKKDLKKAKYESKLLRSL